MVSAPGVFLFQVPPSPALHRAPPSLPGTRSLTFILFGMRRCFIARNLAAFLTDNANQTLSEGAAGRDESSSSSLLLRIGGGRDSIGLIWESIMSAALQNLMKSTKSLAEVASKTVGSQACHQYAKLMEANAKYVLEDKSKLADMPKQFIFTHLAE